jgi:nicotinamidase-related amidase
MSNVTNEQSAVESRTRVALLVIDVQQGLFRKSTRLYNAVELLATINQLVDRAHAAEAPVFYVQHSREKVLPWGSDDWQLHPALHPIAVDHVIQKLHGNSFEETELDHRLASQGVGAHALGYRVILVSDGHSSYSKDAPELIAEWNEKLSHGIAFLQAARDVTFQAEFII